MDGKVAKYWVKKMGGEGGGEARRGVERRCLSLRVAVALELLATIVNIRTPKEQTKFRILVTSHIFKTSRTHNGGLSTIDLVDSTD